MYWSPMCINIWNEDLGKQDGLFGYMMPTDSIELQFTVSGTGVEAETTEAAEEVTEETTEEVTEAETTEEVTEAETEAETEADTEAAETEAAAADTQPAEESSSLLKEFKSPNSFFNFD